MDDQPSTLTIELFGVKITATGALAIWVTALIGTAAGTAIYLLGKGLSLW
jgi:hypothetical protein